MSQAIPVTTTVDPSRVCSKAGRGLRHHRDVVSSVGGIVSIACAVHCASYFLILVLLSLGIVSSGVAEAVDGLWWHLSFAVLGLLFAYLTRKSLLTHLGSVPGNIHSLILLGVALMIGSLLLESAVDLGLLGLAHAHEHHHDNDMEWLHSVGCGVFAIGNLCLLYSHHKARKLIACCL